MEQLTGLKGSLLSEDINPVTLSSYRRAFTVGRIALRRNVGVFDRTVDFVKGR